MTVSPRIKSTVRIVIVLVICYFLIRSVTANWEHVKEFDWSFNYWMVASSIAFFMAGYALLPWIFGRVLNAAGYDISFGDAWNIYWLGNLGRYIPGKVWVILGISYLGAKRGIPRETAAASAVYAQVYSLLSSVVFFFIFLIFTGLRDTYPSVLWLSPLLILLCITGLYPKALETVLNMLLKHMGRSPLTFAVSTRDALQLIAWYAVSWVCMGSAFALFVKSVVGAGSVAIIDAAVIYVVAYVVGFLALFAPGGIGVREGAVSMMLGAYIPVSVGIVIAALSRLLVTFIELLYAGISLSRKGMIDGKKETF